MFQFHNKMRHNSNGVLIFDLHLTRIVISETHSYKHEYVYSNMIA